MTALDTLWYSRTQHPCPLGLAGQLGWFLDEFRGEGLRVFTLQDSPDPALRASHLDHHLPYSIRQGGNVPALWARARGARTRVIGLSWLEEFQGVLSLPGSGIRESGDLAGRRLALPVYDSLVDSRRAEALHGYLVTLGTAGLGAAGVRFVDVAADLRGLPRPGQAPGPFGEYTQQIAALLAGTVDAVYVKGARGLQCARSAQAHVVYDIRRHPDPLARVHTGTPRPITVDETLLREHPEVVVRFLARVLSVGPWARRHPRETVAYLGRETRSSEEIVRQAYGEDVHCHLDTDLSGQAIRALASHQQFLLQWGFIARGFDVQAWIDPHPLAAARERLAREPQPA